MKARLAFTSVTCIGSCVGVVVVPLPRKWLVLKVDWDFSNGVEVRMVHLALPTNDLGFPR